jgi:hypothetical protein
MDGMTDLVLAHKNEVDDLAQEARDLFRQAVQKFERAQQLYAHIYPQRACQGAGAIAYTLDVFGQENPARNMPPSKISKKSAKHVAPVVLDLLQGTKGCPHCGAVPILVDCGQKVAIQRFKITCAGHPSFSVLAVGETEEQATDNWNEDESWIKLGADPVTAGDGHASRTSVN